MNSDSRIRFKENGSISWILHRDNNYAGIGEEVLRFTNSTNEDVLYMKQDGIVYIDNKIQMPSQNGSLYNCGPDNDGEWICS